MLFFMFTIICHCGLVMRKRNVHLIGVAIVRSKSSPVQSSPVVQSTDYRQPVVSETLTTISVTCNYSSAASSTECNTRTWFRRSKEHAAVPLCSHLTTKCIGSGDKLTTQEQCTFIHLHGSAAEHVSRVWGGEGVISSGSISVFYAHLDTTDYS